ncbi:MAG: TIR domain-containing protein [Planctomycetaceae bacterium]|nr:TIR domain-containing protein [Planctomycetales bacterium]MCB9924262.1 TIR domain-containing protein [Planctomycetaceae bacterium]
MSQQVQCPNCGSTDAVFSAKRQEHICEDCRHAFRAEQLVDPLRIFLSYGHDANEELVRLIKVGLEQRGHDVWFDKSEIKFGDNWRRSITEGIVDSHRVLSFLSRHSTRDPGVCRDEVAIALGVKGGNIQTILVESETEVQPPVNIGHVQWLDMHDWKERRAAGAVTWEAWYQEKLAEIVRVVESEESRRFAGEIETLSGHLKPIKPDARLYDLLNKGFFGRDWLFEAVEKWRQDENCTSRLFWITGDPGVGKSAFAAQLTHSRSDAVIAAQFVEWDKPDHRDARRVVRSIAFQLATRLPDYRKLLLTLPEIAELDRKDPAELFAYLLANPLRSGIGGSRDRQLIVIDAFDEAGDATGVGGGRNALVEMLARHATRLPSWFGLVVTSRPESAVQTPLQGLNPLVLDTRTEANRADIRDYLRQQLAPQLHARPDVDRLIEQILERSEGVFLYVERFCDDVHRGNLSLDRPGQFPQGLGGIFFQYFQRQFPDLDDYRQRIRPALRAILAAREPLPIEILKRLFHWQDEEFRDFTRTLGSLFPATNEANGEGLKPCHKSLADWLADEAKAGVFFVSVVEGHRLLADQGVAEFRSSEAGFNPYYITHLPEHLAAAQKQTELAELICSLKYLLSLAIHCGTSYNRGPKIASFLLPYVQQMTAECVKEFPRLKNLQDHLNEIATALGLDSCSNPDMAAKCNTCGSMGIVHGHIDLGGIDFYDNYYAFCPNCFWAFHTENISFSNWSEDVVWKFDYETNTYHR